MSVEQMSNKWHSEATKHGEVTEVDKLTWHATAWKGMTHCHQSPRQPVRQNLSLTPSFLHSTNIHCAPTRCQAPFQSLEIHQWIKQTRSLALMELHFSGNTIHWHILFCISLLLSPHLSPLFFPHVYYFSVWKVSAWTLWLLLIPYFQFSSNT